MRGETAAGAGPRRGTGWDMGLAAERASRAEIAVQLVLDAIFGLQLDLAILKSTSSWAWPRRRAGGLWEKRR
ncbi:hypothetical protein DXC81_10875 [Collinsella tanakaei]|uniref:Uncharacterized protein n=1 Tax=Collinsella tanakaei TaxID=626935 RepID=A0A3E4QNL0_9ACTN|nr:hypothetical protein DXC81_10875 [Collinsella tanakaei]